MKYQKLISIYIKKNIVKMDNFEPMLPSTEMGAKRDKVCCTNPSLPNKNRELIELCMESLTTSNKI